MRGFSARFSCRYYKLFWGFLLFFQYLILVPPPFGGCGIGGGGDLPTFSSFLRRQESRVVNFCREAK
ncbi:MAG: hypothetical protein ACR2P5_00815, partial [Gammaproteobacteria bacterium]